MNDKHSRLNKFEKRRKTTKSISLLLILGTILVILLICIWIFGGGDEEDSTSKDEEEESSDISINNDDEEDQEDAGDEVTKGDDSSTEAESDEDDDQAKEEDSKDDEKIEKEEAEPSDDNVTEAYTASWPAVGTDQEGPHTTDYNDGSNDRVEIEKGSAMATELDENSMITHWVGNGGDQKVVSTVSNADQTEIYRVFLSWNDGEGWQPTKVEKLKSLNY